MTLKTYGLFKEKGIISDGMIPKIDKAFEGLKNGVSNVKLGSFSDLQCLLEGKAGTNIKDL